VAEKKLMVVIGGHAKEFEKMMSGVQRKMQRTGRDMTRMGRGLTTAVTLPIAAVGGAAVKAFAEFDQAMTQSTAIMGDLSADMEDKMSGAAREVAKTTKFSAVEAAESYYYLASAGMDAAMAIEALPQVAAFAQAGNFDMARATDLLTDAQSALGLTVDDVTENMENQNRVSDVLVKANTLANASVEEFAESLTSKGAASLRQMNIEVEEGVAILSVFADQGLAGSEAGTILARTIDGLAERARESSEDFERLGVAVFDSDGEMRNMADIIGDLEGAFEGLTTEQRDAELASLGFNERTRRGILTLMGNSEALREYESELRNAAGTTDEVAEKQLGNLIEQFNLLKARAQDSLITIGETLEDVFLDIVFPAVENLIERFEKLANWFADLDPAWQKVIIGAAAFAAALGPLLIVLGTLIGAVANIMPMFALLAKAFAMVLSPIGLIIAAVAALVAGFVYLWNNNEEFRERILEIWGSIKEAAAVIWGAVVETIEHVVNKIQEFWDKHGERIMKAVESVWGFIMDFIETAITVVKNVILAILAVIRGDWEEAWEHIKTAGQAIWEFISGSIETIFTAIADFLSGVWENITDAIIGKVTEIYDRVTEWFENLQSTIGDIWTGIQQSIREVCNSIIGVIENMVNWSIRQINRFINMVNRAVDVINRIPGVSIGHIPTLSEVSIPRLAYGGNILEAGMAMVGERGPEVVHLPQGAMVQPLNQQQDLPGAATPGMSGPPDIGNKVAMIVCDRRVLKTLWRQLEEVGMSEGVRVVK